MTHEHRCCRFSRCCGFLGTLLASAVLSGAVTCVLLNPRSGNARANGLRGRDALSQGVSVDAGLVKGTGGWSIELRAANTVKAGRRCTITASLTRTRSSVMSRVVPRPRVVWSSSSVALTVPGNGTATERLAIPAAIAKEIAEPKPGASSVDLQDHFAAQVQSTCGAANQRHVS